MIGHLNINSIKNKFSTFKEVILIKTDILLLSETGIGKSYLNTQFFADGSGCFEKISISMGND